MVQALRGHRAGIERNYCELAGRAVAVWNPVVMKIIVTGHQVDVGESLRGYAEERLIEGVRKYFDQAIEGHVIFSHDGPEYRTQIKVHVGKGMLWESRASDVDIRQSFTKAVEHLEKQLRRHKRKLRDYHAGAEDTTATDEA